MTLPERNVKRREIYDYRVGVKPRVWHGVLVDAVNVVKKRHVMSVKNCRKSPNLLPLLPSVVGVPYSTVCLTRVGSDDWKTINSCHTAHAHLGLENVNTNLLDADAKETPGRAAQKRNAVR